MNILKYTHDDGVWVKIEDLKDREYEPLTWREFILANKTSFFPILDKPVILRKSPDPDSEAIINLDSHWFTINVTGEIKDNWFRVEVELYSDGPCETKVELLKTYEGWIQAIDKDGHPLILYFTRGC